MTSRGRLLIVCLAAVAAACSAVGCAAMPDERRATFGLDFRLPPHTPSKPSAIVFFVDGLNRDVFDLLLTEGRLPNVKRYFVDRGLYADRCVANVPGVTLPNQVSLVTGLFPGRHGVTGINWFDRNRLLWRNYETVAQKNTLDCDYLAPTIFERLADATTLSLFFQAHRGATKFTENWMSAGPPYFFGWYDMVDRIALWRFHIVADVARKQGEFPALVIAYLLAPDMEGYRSGVSSEAYRRAIEHADAHIGRILRDLEKAGRLEHTVVVLASDHGMMDVRKHWPIGRFLRDDLALAVATDRLAEETPFERRLDYYRRFSCVLAGSGDRYWAVYLRKPRRAESGGGPPQFENWLVRPSPADLRAYPDRRGRPVDLVARLLQAEAVDLVAWRSGPDHVRLATRSGSAEITRLQPGGRRLRLSILEGDDPLGYRGTAAANMLDGSAHDDRQWLQATAGSQYPDLVPQLLAYFDSPLAGDLAVFAAPEWDFGTRLRAGHGGLRPEEMQTVLLMAGPGVPQWRLSEPVRAVDVPATILDLLGRPVPADLDGRSLLRR